MADYLQVSRSLVAGEDGDDEDELNSGALGPADIKEELFDNVNVHYRQPEVNEHISIRVLLVPVTRS